MSEKQKSPYAVAPRSTVRPVRTQGGKLYGYYDPHTGRIEVRRGQTVDWVDIRALIQEPKETP